MLKNIPSIISPALLKVLCEMGHGDELVLADGNFPSESVGQRVIRMDGHNMPDVLNAVLQLYPLDTYVDRPVKLMQVTAGDDYNPVIWDSYKKIIREQEQRTVGIEEIERFAFYEQAKKAYCVVATGERALYANIILKKGVVSG